MVNNSWLVVNYFLFVFHSPKGGDGGGSRGNFFSLVWRKFFSRVGENSPPRFDTAKIQHPHCGSRIIDKKNHLTSTLFYFIG